MGYVELFRITLWIWLGSFWHFRWDFDAWHPHVVFSLVDKSKIFKILDVSLSISDYVDVLMHESAHLVSGRLKLRSEIPALEGKPALCSNYQRVDKEEAIRQAEAHRRFQTIWTLCHLRSIVMSALNVNFDHLIWTVIVSPEQWFGGYYGFGLMSDHFQIWFEGVLGKEDKAYWFWCGSEVLVAMVTMI